MPQPLERFQVRPGWWFEISRLLRIPGPGGRIIHTDGLTVSTFW